MSHEETITKRKLDLVKKILEILDEDEWRWTDLQTAAIKDSHCSAATFYFAIKFALQKKWLKKVRRGVYTRTSKGKALLEVL